ncbi:hypothetical protein QFZ49_006158 [Streptomyces turgidiscabies]|uniref:Uncharacterized protein n=1 Tax=Streptomyces turgidiscabies TaxID=85558 RepID=A0ABU0RWH9_9ACTN|nr:hypothetical protein [Streptomyces turgidiscabies]
MRKSLWAPRVAVDHHATEGRSWRLALCAEGVLGR